MTNKLKKGLLQLWRDESGQGATEYILILVVVSVIVLAFKEKIKTAIQGLTDRSVGQVEGNMGQLK